MKSTSELETLSRRLRAMTGPADGRGEHLADNMSSREAGPIRAGDLAEIIDELLAARLALLPIF